MEKYQRPNPNLVTCKSCGKLISNGARFCQNCGQRNKKPVYKRWWFIMLMVVATLFILPGACVSCLEGGYYPSAVEPTISLRETGKPTFTPNLTIAPTLAPELSIEFKCFYDFDCDPKTGKISITTKTNMPDGTLIKSVVLDGGNEIYAEVTPVKDGIVKIEIGIDSRDTPRLLAIRTMLKFDVPDIVQPDSIKAILGEYGENLTGENAVPTMKGNNAVYYEDFAYPSQSALNAYENVQGEEIPSAAPTEPPAKTKSEWLPFTGNIAIDVNLYLGKDSERFLFAKVVAIDKTRGIKLYRYTAKDYEWFPWDYWDGVGALLYSVRADDPALPE